MIMIIITIINNDDDITVLCGNYTAHEAYDDDVNTLDNSFNYTTSIDNYDFYNDEYYDNDYDDNDSNNDDDDNDDDGYS